MKAERLKDEDFSVETLYLVVGIVGFIPRFSAAVEDMKGTMVEEYIDAGISMPVCPTMSKDND
jgi:hypothetical protein